MSIVKFVKFYKLSEKNYKYNSLIIKFVKLYKLSDKVYKEND